MLIIWNGILVGEHKVIRGWDEGCIGMKVGEVPVFVTLCAHPKARMHARMHASTHTHAPRVSACALWHARACRKNW